MILTKDEFNILAAAHKLCPNAYGMTIRREVSAATRTDFSIGKVYMIINRLAAKGLVTKRVVQQQTRERGDHAKLFADITDDGLTVLRDKQKLLSSKGDNEMTTRTQIGPAPGNNLPLGNFPLLMEEFARIKGDYLTSAPEDAHPDSVVMEDMSLAADLLRFKAMLRYLGVSFQDDRHKNEIKDYGV